MPKQQHRSREETRDHILHAVEQAGGLTRTQIATAINRAKTPHLIDLIEELVDEGYLVRTIKAFDNGIEGYIYHLSH